MYPTPGGQNQIDLGFLVFCPILASGLSKEDIYNFVLASVVSRALHFMSLRGYCVYLEFWGSCQRHLATAFCPLSLLGHSKPRTFRVERSTHKKYSVKIGQRKAISSSHHYYMCVCYYGRGDSYVQFYYKLDMLSVEYE